MENDGPKSRYHKLEKPVFESKIPTHLLAKLDDKERYLLEQIAKLDSKTDWLVQRAMESNEIAIDTDTRLTKVEDWKAVVTGKGAVVVSLVVLVVTAFASAGARLVMEHFTKHVP